MSASESAIVATLLEWDGEPLTPNLARVVAHSPESFDSLQHGQTAAAIRELRHEGKPHHMLAVIERVKFDGALLFFNNLGASLPLQAGEAEAETLWKAYQVRRAKATFCEAQQAIESAPDKAETIIKTAVRTLEDLSGTAAKGLSIRTPDEILAIPQNPADCILGDRLATKGEPMTIIGPAGLGKSRLLTQLAACSILGWPFIGLETHAPGLRWLIFQTENGVPRLQVDLRHLREFAGAGWAEVNRNLHIHTLEEERDGWLSLESEENQKAISAEIQKFKPDIIGFDPLNAIAIGDLNKDVDMAATCQTVRRICRQGNPQRTIIILHHALTGRAGAARSIGLERSSYGRNSKALLAWTRGQINLAPISEDSNDVLAVACGKCSNGKEFAPFAIRLNPATMIYEPAPDIDLEQWREEMTGKKSKGPLMTSAKVRELCALMGMEKATLAKAIMDDCGCARATAYRHITEAESAKQIAPRKSDGLYFRK